MIKTIIVELHQSVLESKIYWENKEEKKAQFEATQLVWKADKKYAEGFRLASVFMDEENERRLKEEEEKNKKISNNGKVSGRKKGSRR